jgi:hypothetical protein
MDDGRLFTFWEGDGGRGKGEGGRGKGEGGRGKAGGMGRRTRSTWTGWMRADR